jgi:hypothetical protein
MSDSIKNVFDQFRQLRQQPPYVTSPGAADHNTMFETVVQPTSYPKTGGNTMFVICGIVIVVAFLVFKFLQYRRMVKQNKDAPKKPAIDAQFVNIADDDHPSAKVHVQPLVDTKVSGATTPHRLSPTRTRSRNLEPTRSRSRTRSRSPAPKTRRSRSPAPKTRHSSSHTRSRSRTRSPSRTRSSSRTRSPSPESVPQTQSPNTGPTPAPLATSESHLVDAIREGNRRAPIYKAGKRVPAKTQRSMINTIVGYSHPTNPPPKTAGFVRLEEIE